MKHLREKKHIVWYTKVTKAKLKHPWFRRWWLGEVLSRGRAKDIAKLDWKELYRVLPRLNIPSHVRSLWESYFEKHHPA